MNALHVDHVHRVDVMTGSSRLFAECERVAMAFGIAGAAAQARSGGDYAARWGGFAGVTMVVPA